VRGRVAVSAGRGARVGGTGAVRASRVGAGQAVQVVAGVLVAVLVGCSGGNGRGGNGGRGDESRPGPSTTRSPGGATTVPGRPPDGPTTLPEPVPVPQDLAALLVDEAPPGFVADRIPEGMVGPIGVGSLRAALSAETVRVWVEAGFRRGYGRAWRRPVGGAGAAELRSVWVAEFADPAGAAAAAAHTDDGLGERDQSTFPVPDPPGALGRRWVADDFTGPVRVDEVVFTRGPRLYVVRVSAPLPGPTGDAVLRLAAAQAHLAR